jgi:hypothetical protein
MKRPTTLEESTVDVSEFADEIAAAAEQPIATTLLLENNAVRIWDLTLRPGERFPFHRHEYPFLFVCVEGGRQLALRADGRTILSEVPDGWAFWTDLPNGAEIHSIENAGESTIRYTTVEIKALGTRG